MRFLKWLGKYLSSAQFLGTAFTLIFVWFATQYYWGKDLEDHEISAVQRFIRLGHQKSIDWRLIARGPRSGSDQVAVLTIDEKAIEQEGRWPWPRATIKKIIDRLVEHGVKVIGFDIVFADKNRSEGVVALERIQSRYQGSPEFQEIIDEELAQLEGAKNLGTSIEEHAENLVLGTYFEEPPATHLSAGYQNLCLNQLFQEQEAYDIWDSRAVKVVVIDQTAIDVPDEMPDIMSEILSAQFEKIEEQETERFLSQRKEKGLSTELNKTAKIELENKITVAHWRYCDRWLTVPSVETHRTGDPDSGVPSHDEDLDSYKAAWNEVVEEDETLSGLSFEDGLALFKNRQFNSHLHLTGRWWMNLPEIAENAEYSAYFNAFLDPDGTIRESSLLVRSGNVILPSLALTTFLVAKNLIAQVTLNESTTQPGYKTITSFELMNEDGEIVGSIPVSPKGKLKINFAGPQQMFAHVSVADILNDDPHLSYIKRVKDENGVWTAKTFTAKKEDYLKDKVFVWGPTATGVYDLRVTPFEENFPGVETHTNLVDNLMRGDFLKSHKTEESGMLLTLLIGGIVFSYLVAHWGALAGLLLSGGLLGSIYLIDSLFFFGKGIIITIFLPVALFIGLYFVLTIFKYFTEERNKKQLKGTFGKYVSPAIVDEILAAPENIELGGRKEHITVFFSDVRGFTTISEKLDAQSLGDLLNSYLTPMTEIVFENKGTLDKYMGDAIMAFFGAPIHHEDHAKQACRAALQNLEKLKELQAQYQEQGLPMIDVGIGINTGEMSVGNMGSDIVRNYTVMGDAVNLGARLEGINKQYGTRIIVSEFTQKELGDEFVTREIDWVRVKGKAEPVRIFELVAEKSTTQEMEETIKWFNQGFDKYHEMKWDEALDSFSKALNVNPEDPVSKLYLQRCTDYQQTPPPENWDGVFVMTTK